MKDQLSLRALSRAEFSFAQFFLAMAIIADTAAVIAGVAGGLRPEWAGVAAIVLTGIAVVVVWARGASSRYADAANDILRRLDLRDGLGREIDPLLVADLQDDAPPFVSLFAKRNADEAYFGSARTPSPERLVENLRESAWWTKRLAGNMAAIAWAFTWTLVCVAVFALIAAVNGVAGGGLLERAAPWVSAAILFVISQSPHQAAQRYADLRRQAEHVQVKADGLLRRGGASEIAALELAAEYHIARQCAPVIPTVLYNMRQTRLNQLWRSTVQATG